MIELARAAGLAPEQPRYAYVLSLALYDAGDIARALEMLTAAHETRPGDRDVLLSLAMVSLEAGRREEASRYIRAFQDAFPDDPEGNALRARIESPPVRPLPND